MLSKMKRKLFIIAFSFISGIIAAQNIPKSIQLNQPDTLGGLPVMKALSLRASEREFDTTELSLQVLSEVLWAGNGINRSGSGKRTAPSAMNSQDIDIYAFLKTGVFLYKPDKQVLELVAAGDYRTLLAGKQESFAGAPLICLLVSDLSRFKFGEDALKKGWAAIDAGTVSQNIGLYCSSARLATCPRASMETDKVKEVLKLSESQYPVMNQPVGYRKK